MRKGTEQEQAKAAGAIAVGVAEADAFRAAGVEVWELADSWAWLDLGDAARQQARALGDLRPDSPLDPRLCAWAARRTVVLSEPAGLSAGEAMAMGVLARALRVQTAAEKIVHKKWER